MAVTRGGKARQARGLEFEFIEIVSFRSRCHRGRALAGGKADDLSLWDRPQMGRQHDVGMRGGNRGIENRAQERASVGHGVTASSKNSGQERRYHSPCGKRKPPKTWSSGVCWGSDGGKRQPPTSPLMTSPNSTHRSPLNTINWSWLIGAKLVGEVLMRIPGNSTSVRKSFRFAACFMMFSRVRSSPHCLSTCTRVCATAYPTITEPSSLLASGKSLARNARNCFMPGSLSHCGSETSFR